ncbi:MAG TPA: DUF255 domain-containing protein [Terrimicrobiaceae bacterium]
MARCIAAMLAGIWLQCLATQAEEAVAWQPWSEAVFERAKKENKFVLLDLGAVWCHWCHVMEEITYRDPEVLRLINSRDLAVRVDQDARPDLSNRYEDYGWPATIVFNADGGEIVKRQGYIPPRPMASMLQAIIDDPTPGPSVFSEEQIVPSSAASLSSETRQGLRARLVETYDAKNLGWGTVHKFLDWDIIEFCMLPGNGSTEANFEQMAKETLGAQRNLFDPVWGGVYQYSTDGDWKHPHYEKLLQFQAENLRIYSLAFARWGDPEYLKDATQIRGYIKAFLTSPQGVVYTSQDADLVPGEHSEDYFALDDMARRRKGIPRIDKHIYSRENGWTIQALACLYAVTGEKEYLDDALQAARWIISERSLAEGGFSHDENDVAGPYLGDTLSMGRVFLMLYAVTANRLWLERASAAAKFINAHFKSGSGFSTSVVSGTLQSTQQLDENVNLARFANLLHHYSGEASFGEMAEHAMRYLASPTLTERRGFQVAGILLADRELSSPPLHITIVGAKNDPAARALFLAALKQPTTYKRVEWLEASEGPLPNPDVEYPRIAKAAAFLCTDRSCSPPIFTPEKLKSLSNKD